MGAATALAWPMVGRGAELEQVVGDLAVDEVRVVHLVGEAGTGKSRLAAEVLLAAELDGYPVVRITATAAAATVPLSAMSPLLPDEAGDDVTSLFDRASALVRELGDGTRVVITVDDIDALDSVSCALLARLLDEHLVVLVATQRADTPTPDLLLAEHRAGRSRRVELDNLPRTSVGTLLFRVLEGPVSAAAEHAAWTASAGNPLYLRELVSHGVATGRLVRVDGVWVIDGPLDVPGGLAGIVTARLTELDDQARRLVDLLALCAPLGADELAAHVPLDVLESLEAADVITVTPSGRRQLVGLAHPLHAQVVREAMPRLRARRLLLEQVQRVEDHGARRRDDALRLAVWRLDATGTADADLLVSAARLARAAHDYPLVERLAAAAILLEPDVRASTLLGEALYEQGRFDESEHVLAAAQQSAPAAGQDTVRLTLLHAVTLFFGLGRADDALALLDAASLVTDEADGDDAAVVASMRALLLTQAGRSREALAALPPAPPADAAMRAVHDRALAWALHRTAQSSLAAATALEAWDRETSGEVVDGLLHPAGHLMVAALAQLEDGDPEAARATAARGRDAAVAQAVHFQAGWLAWTVATIDLITGFADDAVTAFTELVATSAQLGYGQVERLAALGLTESCALRGDAESAARWFERAMALPAASPAFDTQVVMARAWLAAVTGDGRTGAAMLREAAQERADRGEIRDALMLGDEALVFGDATAAPWLLSQLDDVDTPVCRARRARAEAAVSGDPADILAAAEAFDACGFVHSAALLCAEAAARLRADGDPRAAAAAEARGRGFAERSPGLVVPGLEGAAAVTLTPREREIAGLAAGGRTSKEIAEGLVLSVRTVDNHLANVYTKLGVSSRTELSGAMASVVGIAATRGSGA